MDKLNVCLINDSFPPAIDGVANAVVNYGTYLTKNHGRATVVTPYYPDADDSAFPFPVLRYPSVDVTRLVGYRAGMPFSPELMRKLEDSRFDLIHSHCPITSTMVARSLRDRIHVPVVFTYHTKFDIDIANAVRSKLLQEQAARVLVENIAACDEVWTVSRGAGDNLRKLGYQGEYRVMPNGVDFPRGRVPESLIAEVTGDFDLPGGVPVFLFVGRMMWYKGIRIILDALKGLLDQGRDFRMVFVGGGGDKEEIVAYSRSLGLEGKVLFSEPIRDRERIRAWYCRADLFLFPSTFDTNGLVVREAAACALPSVLVAGSCAAEDVTDGRSGFLIEENAESMARTLLKLMERREQMAQVGEGAQRELYLSWEDAVANAWERYGIVVENYRAGRYPAHEKLSDEFFHGMALTMDALNRSRSRQLQLLQGIRSGVDELRGGVDELKTGVDGLRADLGELRSDLNQGRRKLEGRLEERLEEFYHRIDRFL